MTASVLPKDSGTLKAWLNNRPALEGQLGVVNKQVDKWVAKVAKIYLSQPKVMESIVTAFEKQLSVIVPIEVQSDVDIAHRALFINFLCDTISQMMHRIGHQCHQKEIHAIRVLPMGNSLEDLSKQVHASVIPVWKLMTSHGLLYVWDMGDNEPSQPADQPIKPGFTNYNRLIQTSSRIAVRIVQTPGHTPILMENFLENHTNEELPLEVNYFALEHAAFLPLPPESTPEEFMAQMQADWAS